MNRSTSMLVSFVLLLCTVGTCDAHTVGVSRGEYRADANGLSAELVFARPEELDREPPETPRAAPCISSAPA